MIEKKILIVEDSQSSRALLTKILEQKGFAVASAENGMDALEKMKGENYPLVLTDLEMPVMNGHEFIRTCNTLDNAPIILVLTSHGDTETIIEIMREGVFDYVIKPMKASDLLIRIERALKVAEFKKNQRILEREKSLRMEQQLEWYRWEERGKTGTKVFSSQTLFSNLRTSFNQGAGIGLLVSLLNIVVDTAVQTPEGSWIVENDLFEVLVKNLRTAEGVIKSFSELDRIISDQLKMESVGVEETYALAKDVLRGLTDLARVKKHALMLNDFNPPKTARNVSVNRESFASALREIYVNAMKFSEPSTNVVTMFSLKEGNVEVSIINVPIKLPNGVRGIPLEYENIIFEPFYRIGREVYEAYGSNDFGLGLTIVEKTINRHGGKVFMHNIVDHSDLKTGPLTKVICTIQIPMA